MQGELKSDLNRLASNHAWTWTQQSRRLLESLPGAEPGLHPVGVVGRLTDDQLADLGSSQEFRQSLADALDDLSRLTDGPKPPRVAYLSPEFGLTAALPQYAGGLGVLAGDHLKTASDLDAGIVGVGLFYRQGVFHQVIEHGHQHERYEDIDPREVGASDTGAVVQIPFPHRDVHARVWRMEVGRASLLLLDTDVAANSEHDRAITDRLYVGSRQHRIDQEMVLGVGGALALAEMGFSVDVHHLNEGHAGFVALSLIDRIIEGGSLDSAVDRLRHGLIFTTHTPVPAGIDRFEHGTLLPYLEVWASRWGIPVEQLWALGVDPMHPGIFNMAAFCLRISGKSNGVSRLHGEVSRRMFTGVGIGDRITHVTNGVHARSWTGDHMQDLFDATIGSGWADGAPDVWDRVDSIDDEALLMARRRSSEVLAALVADKTDAKLDPDALVIGFARRFAPYKRATLLLRRPDLLAGLLGDDSHPVHFVFAGKAHPTDGDGKQLVADIVAATEIPELSGRVTFISDYDMRVGHAMVQGADIWLNNPIRPREASGTSGEKAALNGALNCSVLDGWWAEMFDGVNGWAIEASESEDTSQRDHDEATAMLETLGTISDEYHQARPVFLGRVRHAWRTLGPRVVAARMLREYQTELYSVD